MKDSLQNIDAAILDPHFVARLQTERPDLHTLIRNTCAITMLSGSTKINVVTPTAWAELDSPNPAPPGCG